MSGATGWRCSRTCSASWATCCISGLRSEKSSNGSSAGLSLCSHSARLLVDEGPDEGLEQGAVQAEIDLRHPPHGGEAAFVLGVGLDDGPDVVQGARLEAHDPVAADQVRIGRVGRLRRHHRLVQAGRQHVDQVDVGGEFLVLLLGDAARDEDAEMADALVDGVDDGLAAGADVVVLAVEIDDPAQRLLRRGDVVALGAEADDRRADVAQVDAHRRRW